MKSELLDPIKEFMGEGPYPFPLTQMEQVVDLYTTSHSAIMSSKEPFDFLEETAHAHQGYEFLLPISNMPLISLEKKKIRPDINRIIPINSGQKHGPARQQTGSRLLSFYVEKEYLTNLSYSMFGKSEVSFADEFQTVSKDLWDLIRIYMQEGQQRQKGCDFIMESISIHMIVLLLRQLKSNLPLIGSERNYRAENHIRRAIDFMHENYNNNFSVKDIAREAALSPYHFIRVFKAQTGMTPHAFLMRLKLEKAKMYLQETLTITEISDKCGFNNVNHFSSAFKKYTGLTPTEYRKQIFY